MDALIYWAANAPAWQIIGAMAGSVVVLILILFLTFRGNGHGGEIELPRSNDLGYGANPYSSGSFSAQQRTDEQPTTKSSGK